MPKPSSSSRLQQISTRGPQTIETEAIKKDGFHDALEAALGAAGMKESTGNNSVTKGTAPYMMVTVDGTTNRVNGTSFDANGNEVTFGSYDVENRLMSAGGASYGYAPDNKRVWKKPDSFIS